ncbi:MAG: hypothetical protein ACYC5O_13850, partial [Anaerolineae bacterium]
LPATSDLDVNVIVAGPNAPDKRTKFVYRDVLLEISYLPGDLFRSPEAVLGHYHLAGGLSTASIIVDPSGQLAALQATVSRDYAKRQWVRRRCQHASDRVLAQLEALSESDPWTDQVIGWLFATGVTTHVLLAAGLRNPTVRRRYVATRELLADYGRLDSYELLLELLGCARMSRTRVEEHLAAMTEVFDAAAAVIRSPFPFASDISPLARPIAIDGSREMIEQGYHREAIFWIAVTYGRCQQVLSVDAPPEVADRFAAGYRALLADLGITSFAGLQRRGEQVREHLPQVWALAEAIMAAATAIEE